MPTFEKGDMLSMLGHTDLFLFTSNPIINSHGLAVMGRGIAKQLSDLYPSIRREFAEVMMADKDAWSCGRIGGFASYDHPFCQVIGYFHVKEHWASNAKLSVIQRSVDDLLIWIDESDDPLDRIDLNFPGIGNGKLDREVVLPLLERLPDNVHIWEYGQE